MTYFSVIPMLVPMVSILNPSVSTSEDFIICTSLTLDFISITDFTREINTIRRQKFYF